MSGFDQFVVFRLDEQRYALPLDVVERVVRAAEVTPLLKAPPIVLGGLNIGGLVLPVLNVRRRFGLIDHEIDPADQFLIARDQDRTVVLAVDRVDGVITSAPADSVAAEQIVPGLEQIQGVIKRANGLILIHDLKKFLSLDEARALDEAMTTLEPSHGEG